MTKHRQRSATDNSRPPRAPASVTYTLVQFLRSTLWLWVCVVIYHTVHIMTATTNTAAALTTCSGIRLRKHKGRKLSVPCDRSSQTDVLAECNIGDDVYSLCTHCLPRLGRLPGSRNPDTDGPTGKLTAHGCYAALCQFGQRVQTLSSTCSRMD